MKNNYKANLQYSGFIMLFVMLGLPLLIQGQVTTFQKIYSNIKDQSCKDVLPTPDGGYIVAGTIENNIVNDLDIRVMKTNKFGDTLWTKTYASPDLAYPNCILQTNDGNYFIVGYSQAPVSDQNIYLLKIDPSGNVLWSKVYGGFGNEDGKEIVATADGNYVIVGASNSINYSNNDMQLIKIDPAGTVIWTKYYGGPNYESARSVRLCSDGGFILAGKTASSTFAIAKIYMVRTNSLGDTTWTKTYIGSNSYEGKFILTNGDGSYTLCVDDSSASRDSDIRVMKIDGNGTILWNKMYGGTEKDICKMIQHTSDGGYIVAGVSRSFGWMNPDMWLLKLNAAGDTTWSRHFGGLYHDHSYAVRQTPDGGYVAVGHNRDVNSSFRGFLVKVNEFGNFVPVSVEELALNNAIGVFPNPTSGIVKIDFGGDLSASAFKIINALGQEVISETINTSNQNESRSIDLQGREPGIYFVYIRSAKYSTTKKLILQ